MEMEDQFLVSRRVPHSILIFYVIFVITNKTPDVVTTPTSVYVGDDASVKGFQGLL